MTSDGLNRLMSLFKDDVDRVEFDVEGVTQSISSSNLTFDLTNNRLDISGTIGASEEGLIDNFKVVGATIEYDVRTTMSFTKASGQSLLFTIPYELEVKVI